VEQYLNAKTTSLVYEESEQWESNQPPPGFEFERSTINDLYEVQLKPVSGSRVKHTEVTRKPTQDHSTTPEIQGQEEILSRKLSPVKTQGIQTNNSYKEALLNDQSEASSSTSESLIELAKKSLQVGELLGLRVTGDVEAAISRITTPLKKSRKQGKRSKKNSKN